jgi:hypothetical protein
VRFHGNIGSSIARVRRAIRSANASRRINQMLIDASAPKEKGEDRSQKRYSHTDQESVAPVNEFKMLTTGV